MRSSQGGDSVDELLALGKTWYSSGVNVAPGLQLGMFVGGVGRSRMKVARHVASIFFCLLDEEVVNYGDDQRPFACSDSSVADLNVVLFPAAMDTMSQRR